MFFFFNDTATTEIYTLSLHDALPIWGVGFGDELRQAFELAQVRFRKLRSPDERYDGIDRKSTRLNSSHANISYAVFCLKKKNLEHSECTYTRDYASHRLRWPPVHTRS